MSEGILIVPQDWVDRHSPLPTGWLAARAPGLVRVLPAADETVERVAREVGLDPRLLVTRMEVEQSAVTYGWDGSLRQYTEADFETLARVWPDANALAECRIAHGDVCKLGYLCGVDKPGPQPRVDGWFGPELQLYGCALRFKHLYRGRGLPGGLSRELPSLPAALRGLPASEDVRDPQCAPDGFAAGHRIKRGGTWVLPSNQASADCLRYAAGLEGSRNLARIGREWFAEDYDCEEGGVSPPPASKKLLVLIDPGHGAKYYSSSLRRWVRDTGAAGGGLSEADVVMATGRELAALLRGVGHDARLSHESVNYGNDLGPSARGRWAAGLPYDVFVSIHLDSGDPGLRGTCGFYPNEQSPKSRALAMALAHEVKDEFGVPFSYDRGDGARVHWDKLGVFYGGSNYLSPGALALIEGMFMSNSHDVKMVQASDFPYRYARALARGIHLVSGLKIPVGW